MQYSSMRKFCVTEMARNRPFLGLPIQTSFIPSPGRPILASKRQPIADATTVTELLSRLSLARPRACYTDPISPDTFIPRAYLVPVYRGSSPTYKRLRPYYSG